MKNIFLLLFIFFLSSLSQKSLAQKDTIQRTDMSLRDMYAFKTAAEMYAVADTLRYSANADLIIKEISRNLEGGMMIENKKIWDNLKKLEPYRMNPKVQNAVKLWVDKMVNTISNSKQKYNPAPLKSLQSISYFYKLEDFERTEQECLTALSTDPVTPDIRSNLGLALIHLKKDLCAQIELEIATRLFDKHTASMINLTVVYERLNKKEEAEKTANKLMLFLFDNQTDDYMIRYNAAWFKNRNEKFEAAEYILENPNSIKNAGINKYDSLRVLNLQQFDQQLNK